MNGMNERIYALGVIPVVVLNRAEDARPLARALCEGGLPCAEVTFRTDAAEQAIRIMTNEHPEMLVGAGTVISCEQVDRAVEAGAAFVVNPGLDEEVVCHCLKRAVPVFPGVLTPGEIQKALNLGLDVVKFFPSENFGGLNTIKSLAAPFPGLKFMPTGGINETNVRAYLQSEHVLACGGSWMVKNTLIEAGAYDRIRELCAQAVGIVKEIRS